MNPLQFSANLTVSHAQIKTVKGEEYTNTLNSVAESFRTQIEQLPENIQDIAIKQETEVVSVSPKTSIFDAFAPIFLMRFFSGDYQNSYKLEVKPTTIATITGRGPRGGKHTINVELSPQEMPPLPVFKKFFGFFKREGIHSEADFKQVETVLTQSMQNVLKEAQAFSESRSLLGSREYEKRYGKQV